MPFPKGYPRPLGSGRKPNHLLSDRDWLYQRYVIEELGGKAIAELTGTTDAAVYHWLHKHGIDRRPTSKAVAASNIRRTGWKSPRDASGENNPNWRGGPLTIYCDWCNGPIERQPSLIAEHNFCNCDCLHTWLRDGNRDGEKNANWKGGISTDPGYSDEFNGELKEQIRSRDDYICQACGMTEVESVDRHGRVLGIHHIDYDKTNNEENNLITLCVRCNSLANTNREKHTRQFRRILNLRHGYA